MQPFIDPITWANYVPVIVYLIAVTGLVALKRVWHPVHALGLLVGLPVRFLVEGPVSLIAPALAAVVCVACVWALSKTISATGVFTFVVALALLPVNGWPGLAMGLLAALIVGLARTSLARTKQVGTASLLSMGVTPHGIGVPNLNYMPQKSAHATGKNTMLPPYFLGGVVVGALLEYLLA